MIRSTSLSPAKLGKDGEAILLPRVLPEEARLLALHRGTRGRILHFLRFGAVILEALPEHDLVRGLKLQAEVAEATLQKYPAIRISDAFIFLVDVHSQLAGGARVAAKVEKAALGTASEAGLLVEVAKNMGCRNTTERSSCPRSRGRSSTQRDQNSTTLLID